MSYKNIHEYTCKQTKGKSLLSSIACSACSLTFERVLHDLPTEPCGDCGAGLHGRAAVDLNQPRVVVTADHEVSTVQLKRIL